MKNRTAGILLGFFLAAGMLAGCGSNEATEAANESAETEKEGQGEDAENSEADASAEEEGEESAKVGILLPSEEEETWSSDAKELRACLEADGYQAEILWAQGDSELQAEQVHEMAEKEASALIIAPVDEYGLSDALAETKEKGIYVFSYDDLIRDSDGVNYYTTFSGRSAGRMIGEKIVEMQGLEDLEEGAQPRTIEFLMGSPDDVQALFFYNGVMEILKPYLDSGKLVCPSGRTDFDDTGILREGKERAGEKLQSVLDEYYQDGSLPQIICTGYDDAAYGIQELLAEAGRIPGGEGWPMITGVGCQPEVVKKIAEGSIFCSIFMDRRTLAEECVKMVDTYLKGDTPEINNYEEYDNGKKIIGTYMCDMQLIDSGNYELLIDNGTYTEDQVAPEITPTPTPEPTPTAEASPAAEAEEVPEVTEAPAQEAPGKPAVTETPEATPTPVAGSSREDQNGYFIPSLKDMET